MRFTAKLAVVLCFFSCAPVYGQTLVYSLSYSDTAASRRLWFAKFPPPGQRSEQQDIESMRYTAKNEIYSISIPDGKASLLFSDAGTQLEIRGWGSVSGTTKTYAAGLWRGRCTTPTPGYCGGDGIYELSLDGSNQARRVADGQKQGRRVVDAQMEGRPILNPQATKAAVQGTDNQSILIYSVADWKLLATLDLAKLSRAHCPACTLVSFGWMADGNRLYVELYVAVEEDKDEVKADHPGIYILSGDGADLGIIPAAIGAFQLSGYVHNDSIDRHFIGQLPDGRYLFQDYATKQGSPRNQSGPVLVISGADPKLQKYFPLKFGVGDCYISPSGRYIAYLESRSTPDYRSEQHLWVKDLDSGEEKDLAATPPSNPPSSPQPNVALFVLGWMR
jgi:hypothetical protein